MNGAWVPPWVPPWVSPAVSLGAAALVAAPVQADNSFVNWESPHVSPVDRTPDGARLLVVNTADNRLEVFDVSDGGLARAGSVPVGLDPVSVRARTDDEAWVVNHVSDSISIVDLTRMNTRATIDTGDEPADVVFAGEPQRAFVSISQLNQVRVYDPADPLAAPIVLTIEGEDPRALTTDGTTVFAAIFESGNGTTILNQEYAVSVPEINPYPGDPNPPPNAGASFSPPFNPDLPEPPPVGLIVRRDGAGTWRDDNAGDWSAGVDWELHDHDVAMIDANTLAQSYLRGVMNLNMHLALGPGGTLAVVGTDAMNLVRFEPNQNGVFVRVKLGLLEPDLDAPGRVLDLNPHLTYETPSVPPAERVQSVGDPRGVEWSADGENLYVAGMGSNNLLFLDATGGRLGLTGVGAGPTGIVVDDARRRLYVVNKFDGSVSIVDTIAQKEIARVPFYDPTPAVIEMGRPHLYDTHATSGLGQASCASCHVDGRTDQLAWDLGNPAGETKAFNEDCIDQDCLEWHPMKGPMATQTMIGLAATAPFHWRGDREDLAAFNPAFESLLGADQISPKAMEAFTEFAETLTFPPNPFRNTDGTLKSLLPNGGDPIIGEILFFGGGGVDCNGCHSLPAGTNGGILGPRFAGGITQNMKPTQFRGIYEKMGFDGPPDEPRNKGFGFAHDGSFKSIVEFISVFFFHEEQHRRDLEAYLMSFGTDTHAGVGAQVTLADEGDPDPTEQDRLDEMIQLADFAAVGLVVRGRRDGLQRGYAYLGEDVFQADRAAEILSFEQLAASVGPGAELTFTLVPLGTERRIGVDRDEDGHFDRDEIDAGSDPADPESVPTCLADFDSDGAVGLEDVVRVLSAWGPCPDCPEDLNDDGVVDFDDLLIVLDNWGPCV